MMPPSPPSPPSDAPVVVPGRIARERLPAPREPRTPAPAVDRNQVPGPWLPLLDYHAELHLRSTHGALAPLERDWVEIGPGYLGGPCFGHWDAMHAALDALSTEPLFCRDQILNQIELQSPSGAIPGVLAWNASAEPFLLGGLSPGCWPIVLDDWLRLHGPDPGLQRSGLGALGRLLSFMERERRAPDGGFFFADARDRVWESGIDDGVRFDAGLVGGDPVFGFVDATGQTALHYQIAARWASELGEESLRRRYGAASATAESFLRDRCLEPDSGWYFDAPMTADPGRRILSFEGIWALWARGKPGAEADRAIDGVLLSADGLLGNHGLLTVGRREELFERRMWRGPSWNSMTYWAARACLRCGREDAARLLLRRALDGAATVFAETGTVWEFYGPDGEDPRGLHRKPGSERDQPCPDYLGHNPLFAMVGLFLRLDDGNAS